MQEFLLSLLSYLPRFFVDFGRVLLEPKRTAASQVALGDAGLRDGFVFAGLAVVLLTLLPSPLLPKADLVSRAAFCAPYYATCAGLIGVICYWSWRLFGAKRHETEFFTIYLFQAFSLAIIGYVLDAVGRGLFAAIDSDFYARYMETVANGTAAPPSTLSNSGFQFYYGVLGIGLLAASAWQIIAWGAYREMFGLTRSRSAGAFVVASAAGIPAMVVLGLLAKGLSVTR